MNEILRDNEDIELLRDQILRLEETGYLPKMDYQTCQPVMVAREPRQPEFIASLKALENIQSRMARNAA